MFIGCRTSLGDGGVHRRFAIAISICLTGQALLAADPPSPVTGKVLGPSGSPVIGARVRLQGSDQFTTSGAEGLFSLDGIAGPGKVTAGLAGFRNGFAIASGGGAMVEIRLRALPAADNKDYVWDHPITCVQCHALHYPQWIASPHASSAADPVVLALYLGTRYDGSPSPGYGFRKSHPETYGDCAFCHAPAFAARSEDPLAPLEPRHDLERALKEGTDAERLGVMCEFCHKVQEVTPGGDPPRRGHKYKLLRPPQFEPLMFGSFDDVTFPGMGASYSPLHGEASDLCSLCHWDTNRHGVTVGGQYPEWRDGPYPAQGKRCQDCHMKPDENVDFFCLLEPVVRNPQKIYSHRFLGTDLPHLAEALTLEIETARVDGPSGSEISLEVSLRNSGAGHSVPAGSTFRQVLLIVEARRAGGGDALPLSEGPRLPAWAGEGGPPERGYLSGQPGKGYAKITTDGQNERVFDSEATAIVSDSRLAPLATDRTSFRFALEGYRGALEVRARAIYRKWWKDLQDERGFPDGDTVMAEKAALLPAEAARFLRGDGDGTGSVDISDAVAVLGFLFTAIPPALGCADAGDADDNGLLEITDALAILGYLFLGGEKLPEPFPDPGIDPTEDELDC